MSTVVEHSGTGLAELVRDAANADPGADLAVVAIGTTLPAGWLDALQDALRSNDALAAATAFGEESGSYRPHPGCTLIRSGALAILGGLDGAFPDAGAALADFAARARGLGLSCAVVPAVSLPPGSRGAIPSRELAMLHARHPWLRAALEEEASGDPGPLKRAVIAARAAREGLSVTIDARSLGSGAGYGGTQTYVSGLVLALARSGRAHVRAVLADPGSTAASRTFQDAGVEVVSYEQAASGTLRLTDVVHRPQQVFTPSDLRLLELLGERLVVSHMDLIAYHAPAYHSSTEDWRAFRRTTRLALMTADSAIFFSEHARGEALAEELIPADRALLAGIGVDPDANGSIAAERPAGIPQGRELLVMIGTDYAHKNRRFAVELVRVLRERHAWRGLLVLAGAHVDHGAADIGPAPASEVIDVGLVSEGEKAWLARNAVAHLAPSAYEGFGLAPLEAAAAGRPCIYAAVTSLREIIDPTAATIVPWDPVASAERAASLLSDGPARERHMALLQDAVRRYSWERMTPLILDAYDHALRSPYRSAAPRAWGELVREHHIEELTRRYKQLDARTRAGLPLIDAGGPLLTPAEQRGLMRIASRSWLRRPLLGPLGLLGSDHRGRSGDPADGDVRDSSPLTRDEDA